MKRGIDECETLTDRSAIISPIRTRHSAGSPIPGSAFVSIVNARNMNIVMEESLENNVKHSDEQFGEMFFSLLRPPHEQRAGALGRLRQDDAPEFQSKSRRLSFDETDNEEDMHNGLRNVLDNLSVYDMIGVRATTLTRSSRNSPFHSTDGRPRISTAPQWTVRSRPTTPVQLSLGSPSNFGSSSGTASFMSARGSPAARKMAHNGEVRNSFTELHRQFACSSPSFNVNSNFLHFNIIRSLGSGASSDVFKVEDPVSLRKFAIKRSRQESLRSDEIRRSRKAFLLEVETLYMLNRACCPNISRIFNAWEEDSQFYLLMECATHGCLQDLIDQYAQQNIAVPQCIIGHVLYDACHALRHMHAMGVVHLDIKPSNLLICENGVVKLADFGQAHVPGKAQGCEGDQRYVAKEVPGAVHWDPQPSADIFSLGVSVYCLACPHFDPPREGTEWLALRTQQYQPLPDDLSPSMRELIAAMLHPDPSLRPTAEQIITHPEVARVDLLSYISAHSAMVDEVPPFVELNRSASFTSAMSVVASI